MNLLGWLPRLIAQPNPVQQKLAQLESQLATAQKRLQESITIAATPVSPLDRFVDGDRYLVPGGTRQDRQWGSNRPVLNQQWDLNQMRTNARLLLDANGFAIGGMDRLIDFVVGEGFKREITLRDAEPGATSDTEDPLIRQVTMLLDDWCKRYEWGHGEEDREAETFKRTSRDGEVFTRVDKDKESDSWMPWIRFVEPEHVYTPPDKSQMSEWSWGILTKEDDVETRLAYWVVDPKAQTQAGDVVDAADIFHHKVNTDRTIKRGISDFFPVFDTFESARKILRNMGEVAAIQAAIAWIRQHAATTTADQVQRMIDRTKNYDQTNMRPVFPQGPDNTQPVTFTEPGQVLDMSNGMQYLAGPSATGSPGFIQVLQATLRGAGARWGAPEFFSGDASNNNFASILVSGSPFERYAKRRQSAFSAYQERIFYRVLEYAEKAGKVPPGTCGRIKIRCIPPAVAIANRNEDEQIRAQQNQAGVLSRTTWQRQVNLDPKIEAENFRREKEEDAQGQQQDGLGQGMQSPGFESVTYTQSQYKRLSEGARSGLVKKMITNKLGDHQTVWTRPAEVNPSADAGHHSTDDHADATPTEATKNAFATLFGKARELGNKAMNSKVGRVLKEAEHKLGIAAHKTRDVAVKAAEMRGLDEGQTKKLKASLAMADFFGGYVSGAAAGAVAGPLGAKVAMFMPSASAVYLAYSTAKDPVATWKAALQVVEESSIDPRHVASAFSKAWFATESAYHWVDALADLLKTDPETSDWRHALFLAALAATGDPEHAIEFVSSQDTPEVRVDESWYDPAALEWVTEGRNLSGLTKVKRTDKNGVSRYVYVRSGGDAPANDNAKGKTSGEHESHVARVHAMFENPQAMTFEHLDGLADDLGKMTVAELKNLRTKTGVPTGRLKADRINKIVAYAKEQHAKSQNQDSDVKADAVTQSINTPKETTDGQKPAGAGSDPGRGSGAVSGKPEDPSQAVAYTPSGPGSEENGGLRGNDHLSADQRAAERVPATLEAVNRRLDRYAQHFSKHNHELAGWMNKLKDHVNQFGVESALKGLGEDRGDGAGAQYEGAWTTVSDFTQDYLNANGISLVNTFDTDVDPSQPVVSSSSPSQGGMKSRNKNDYTPEDPTLSNKLDEAKSLPGLEASEDINVIVGKKVTHLTPDVMAKFDEKYGKGRWIVKAYGDDAAAGYGIFFPQRAEQIRRDAQNTIWDAGGALAQYGFSVARDADNNAIGIKHTGGDLYKFGTKQYEDTINGDVRTWGDRVAAVAANEQGAELPGGGHEFMAQPAFNVVGVSEADRAAGKTIAPGEGRVHIITRNGKAEVVPHSTWIKGDHLPVVFESEETLAMAKAAQDAINALPESERNGQIYAPDIVKTDKGYSVVEANPANHTGSSGYLGDSPFIIDSYVSHLTNREPAHVQFIRKLLTTQKRAD